MVFLKKKKKGVRDHSRLPLRRSSMTSPSNTNDLIPAITRSNVVLTNLWEEAVNEFITQTDLSEAERLSLGVCDTPEAVFDVTRYNWSRKLTRKQLRNNQIAQKTVSQVLVLFRVVDVALGLASAVLIFYELL